MNIAHRRVVLLLCTLPFCIVSGATSAASYTDGLLTLDVPAGFEGPVKQSPGAGATVVAYTKRTPGVETATLLQITTYDFGSQSERIPDDQRVAAADRYLAQFLTGVEKRRGSFTKSPTTHLPLGGIPAARVRWTGVVEGKEMTGVMYCVVVGTRVISFHTQAPRNAPPENLSEAMRSIEAVKFKK